MYAFFNVLILLTNTGAALIVQPWGAVWVLQLNNKYVNKCL